jgi:hypothetical protein
MTCLRITAYTNRSHHKEEGSNRREVHQEIWKLIVGEKGRYKPACEVLDKLPGGGHSRMLPSRQYSFSGIDYVFPGCDCSTPSASHLLH